MSQLASAAGPTSRPEDSRESEARPPSQCEPPDRNQIEPAEVVILPLLADEQEDYADDCEARRTETEGRGHDEWRVAERRYLSEASMAKLCETDNDGADRKEVGTTRNELLAR
jgi:hypothetical protein